MKHAWRVMKKVVGKKKINQDIFQKRLIIENN